MGELEEGIKKHSTITSLDELEFEVPSWDQIYSSLLNLANAIRNTRFTSDIIVGVSRGGWLPARILSDLLENARLANVTAEFYVGTNETKPKPAITQPISISVKDQRILLVDDVADTGKSLKLVKAHLKEHGAIDIKVATIYYKPWSILVPDFYVKETCLWIVFPWELKETVRRTIEKFRRQGKSVKDIKAKLVSTKLNKHLVERFVKELFREDRD